MNKSSVFILVAAVATLAVPTFHACSDDSTPVGSCVDETCMNICADRECGPSIYNLDYSCGECDGGWACRGGTCIPNGADAVVPDSIADDSGDRDTSVDNGVGGDNGTGDAGQHDSSGPTDSQDDADHEDAAGDATCLKDCTARECGPDPVCALSCGECGGRDECVDGICKCFPFAGRVCGDDGCGTSLGDCPSDGQICDKGQCVTKVPDDMVKIPGGEFSMGCSPTATTIACDADEKPAHDVSITEFLMDRTEVTRAAFQKCVDVGECDKPNCNADVNTASDENMPVACVTWKDAAAYCAWMGRRLPTEAEWEYAARYNDDRVFPWGANDASCTYAQMWNGSKSGCGTGDAATVCSKSTKGDSLLGLCDMAGNVWEWVNDFYSSSYYGTGVATDPQGPSSGLHQVRGGGWFYDVLNSETKDVRSSNRWAITIDSGLMNYVGFRCAM